MSIINKTLCALAAPEKKNKSEWGSFYIYEFPGLNFPKTPFYTEICMFYIHCKLGTMYYLLPSVLNKKVMDLDM